MQLNRLIVGRFEYISLRTFCAIPSFSLPPSSSSLTNTSTFHPPSTSYLLCRHGKRITLASQRGKEKLRNIGSAFLALHQIVSAPEVFTFIPAPPSMYHLELKLSLANPFFCFLSCRALVVFLNRAVKHQKKLAKESYYESRRVQ